MLLDGGAIGREVGHEGRGLMNGVSALISDKRDFMVLPSLYCQVRTGRESAVQERAFTWMYWHPDLGLQPPEL